VSPQVVLRRNHEKIPRTHLEKQISLYRKMAKDYNVTIINNDLSFEEINDKLVYDILTNYYANFRTFTKGLLLANPNQLNPERKQ